MDEKLISAVSGRSGSFWVAPGSRKNVLGTASGRQVGPSWPPSWPSWPPCNPPMLAVLDAKLAARDDPNNARSRPRPRFERVHQRARRSHRFFVVFVVARKLRCASRTSFYSVLLGSHEISTTRAREARKLENRGISASKNDPEAVQDGRNRARAAKTNAKSEVNPISFF